MLQNRVCPRCGAAGKMPGRQASRQNSFGQQLWWMLGLGFILLAVIIVAGTFWFVENRRTQFRNIESAELPAAVNKTGTETESAPSLNLLTMGKEDLVKLLPSYALVRLRSEAGEGRPDELKPILDGTNQYVVMLGSRSTGKNKKERLLMVFKLDNEQLTDVTKQAVPESFIGGRIGNELSRINFAENGRDLEMAVSLWPNDNQVEECPVCDHAYFIQQLIWQESKYKLGQTGWHNDSYTACYIAMQALDKKKIEPRDRPFVSDSLDAGIEAGIEHRLDRSWSTRRISPEEAEDLETATSASYRFTNGVISVTTTASKKDGRWQVTEIKREDL
jgi:hypothetical protein